MTRCAQPLQGRGTGEAILCPARAPAGCRDGRRGVGETVAAPTLRIWPMPEGGRDCGQRARASHAEEEGGQEELPPAARAGYCRHFWCALCVIARLSVRMVARPKGLWGFRCAGWHGLPESSNNDIAHDSAALFSSAARQ
jgi:hypothetical protein